MVEAELPNPMEALKRLLEAAVGVSIPDQASSVPARKPAKEAAKK